jgi:hypothetical protein
LVGFIELETRCAKDNRRGYREVVSLPRKRKGIEYPSVLPVLYPSIFASGPWVRVVPSYLAIGSLKTLETQFFHRKEPEP